jgi:hypothetical protein
VHESLRLTSYTPSEEEQIMVSGKPYVYYWEDIDETIVYVGKGRGRRMLEIWRGEEIMIRYLELQSIGKDFTRKICAVCEDEGAAFRLESWMIKRIGRRDLGTGPLYNRREGTSMEGVAVTLSYQPTRNSGSQAPLKRLDRVDTMVQYYRTVVVCAVALLVIILLAATQCHAP